MPLLLYKLKIQFNKSVIGKKLFPNMSFFHSAPEPGQTCALCSVSLLQKERNSITPDRRIVTIIRIPEEIENWFAMRSAGAFNARKHRISSRISKARFDADHSPRENAMDGTNSAKNNADRNPAPSARKRSRTSAGSTAISETTTPACQQANA